MNHIDKGEDFRFEEEVIIKLFRLPVVPVLLIIVLVGCTHVQNKESTHINETEPDDDPDSIQDENEVLLTPIYDAKDNRNWQLVWNDEFLSETSILNWSIQDWPSDKNGEWQYYSPDNISIRENLLIIESRKERYKGRGYTSGALTTEEKFEFKYGLIEIKAKIPKGQGVFPAFWLVNSDGGNWLPEIDIMENLGQSPNELYYVVHWENSSGEKMRDYFRYESENTDFSDDFHIYGLLLEEDTIVWTQDGTAIFETREFSPNVPLFLYMNTAIGGVWPGKPDPFDEYPKEMQIDYVRVFQQENRR